MISKLSPDRSLFPAARRWVPFLAALLLLIVAVAMLVVMLWPDDLLPSSVRSDTWPDLRHYYSHQRALFDSGDWTALDGTSLSLRRSVEAGSAH